MDKAQRTEIINKFARKEGDTGSPEVQIALLSGRISELTEHLKANPKDHSTRRGLLAMVSLRKKLLSYLARENRAKYLEITDALGSRRAKSSADPARRRQGPEEASFSGPCLFFFGRRRGYTQPPGGSVWNSRRGGCGKNGA